MGLGFESLRVYKKLRRINLGSSEFFFYAPHGVTLFFIVSLQPMNRTDLTQGSIWGNITTFLLLYILAYFLQILYVLADLFVIGRYCGVDSTTAVSNGAQVIMGYHFGLRSGSSRALLYRCYRVAGRFHRK